MNGDTQPLSQWVYEQYANEIKAVEQETNRSPETQRTGKKSSTPHTYVEGQTGHIDLLGALDATPARRTHPSELAEEDEDVGESQLDVHAELYPESKRFQLPKTPATNGKKRGSDGEVIGSARTSAGRPVNPLAGYAIDDSGIMDLSQVFQATQAASSPGPGINQTFSDVPLERPSPTMNQPQRPSTAGSLSSPARIRMSAQRTVPEPHARYISMKESQEERERELRRRSSPIRNDSDDEFSSEEIRNQRREMQRRIAEKARKQFMEVTAEPRPRAKRGRTAATRVSKRGQRSSPLGNRHSTPPPLVISDYLAAEELGNLTEDETEREQDQSVSEHESRDELAEDNKENVHDDVHVPASASRKRWKTTLGTIKHTSPTMHRFLKLTPDRRNQDDLDGDEVDELANDDGLHHSSGLTQTTAIADSQPVRYRSARARTRSASQNPAFSSPTPALPSKFKDLRRPGSIQREASPAQSVVNGPSASKLPSQSLRKSTKSPARRDDHSPDSERPGTRSFIKGTSRSRSPGIVNVPQSDVPEPPSASDAKRGNVSDDEAGDEPIMPTRLATSNLSRDPSTGLGRYPNGELLDKLISTNGSVRTPRNGGTRRSTIPETSSAAREVAPASPELPSVIQETPGPSLPKTDSLHSSKVQHQPDSKVSEPFETAQTHLSESLSKARLPPVPRSSSANRSVPMLSSSLPLEAKKIRKFAEIAEELAPPDDIGAIGDIDVDIELMTAEDIEFQAMMEGSSPIGPRRKRRRRFAPPADPTSDMEIDQPVLPFLPSQHPVLVSHAPRGATPVLPITPKKNPPPASSSPISSLPASSPRPPLPTYESEDVLNSSAATTSETSPSKAAPPRASSRKQGLSNAEQDPLRIEAVPKAEHENVIRAAATGTRTTHCAPCSQSPEVVTAPNRVLAHFMGNTPGYYPATCLSKLNGPEPKYKVRFDDGTVGMVSVAGVKRLELRVGDVIKVDKERARITNWIVHGFGEAETHVETPDQVSTSSSKIPSIDIFGHETVLLGSPKKEDETLWAVPIAQIYLNQSLWVKLSNRTYSGHDELPKTTSDLLSPSISSSAPTTPKSRGRRGKLSALSKSIINLTTSSRNQSPIFENMVFNVTGIEDLALRNEVEQGIRSHGGTLLDSEGGFEELFDVPLLEPVTPSKRKPKNSENEFRLNASSARHGFTCLISDSCNRKPKFFQALALGIPCLATRWVTDCIKKQSVLPWERYLLPSGASVFLEGAVRSRILPPSDPSTTTLSTMVEARPTFLAGHSIMLVIPKKDENRMISHPFMAYALGAKRVARVGSLEEARQTLLASEAKGEDWEFVCYYEPKEGVRADENIRAAESTVLGGSGKGKRKRGSGEGEALKNSKTRVVTSEFIIQSLILGDLVDEE